MFDVIEVSFIVIIIVPFDTYPPFENCFLIVQQRAIIYSFHKIVRIIPPPSHLNTPLPYPYFRTLLGF